MYCSLYDMNAAAAVLWESGEWDCGLDELEDSDQAQHVFSHVGMDTLTHQDTGRLKFLEKFSAADRLLEHSLLVQYRSWSHGLAGTCRQCGLPGIPRAQLFLR